MPTKCLVHNCNEPAIANGLCRKHYMRVKRHGEVNDTRPADWGQREKHSAYRAWCGLLRYHRQDMDQSWAKDFWVFAEAVGDKPENAKAKRPDSKYPWSKENFYWKTVEKNLDRAEYAKAWRKKVREANLEYYQNQDFQRTYSVSLEWYKETLSKQNGVCAICEQPETTVIRGKQICLSVDHCHKTGKTRGLLCTKCNRGLGLFRDKISILNKATSYLNIYL